MYEPIVAYADLHKCTPVTDPLVLSIIRLFRLPSNQIGRELAAV